MEDENARSCFAEGVKLLQAEDLEGALGFFSRAVELDPDYTEAANMQSYIMKRLGRIDEEQEAARELSNKNSGRLGSRKVNKINLDEVDNVVDDLAGLDDGLDFDNDLYDFVFSDDILESEEILKGKTKSTGKENGSAAILEYLNSSREEIPWAYLFQPTPAELTLKDEEDAEPRTVFLEQLSCIRLARPPSGCPRNRDANCHVEVIETHDGNIYHEAVHPTQNLQDVLFGFSTKKDTRFKYTLIPLINIRKRYQRRHLGQILIDKNHITDASLKKLLAEYNELKKVKFGQIIAKQAKLLYSAVESEIQRAYAQADQNLKIGEILLNAGLVNHDQVEAALAYQKKLKNKKLGRFLIDKGILQEKEVYMALSEKFRIPYIDLRKQKVSAKTLSLLPSELIRKLMILPLSVKGDTLEVVTLLPDPDPICETILKYSPLKDLAFYLTQPSHLRNVINLVLAYQQNNTG